MVCLYGGKDSSTMLDVLLHYQKQSDTQFEIVAVNLDQKQPGYPEEVFPKYFSELGVEFKIVEKDTCSIFVDKIKPGKTMCSLCSRSGAAICILLQMKLALRKLLWVTTGMI